MNKSGVESGNCVKCDQMVYVSRFQFEEDGEKYIHWSCKEENKEEILKQELKEKLHNAINVMPLSQLKGLNKSLFS